MDTTCVIVVSVLSVLIILGVAAYLLFRRYRNKQRQRENMMEDTSMTVILPLPPPVEDDGNPSSSMDETQHENKAWMKRLDMHRSVSESHSSKVAEGSSEKCIKDRNVVLFEAPPAYEPKSDPDKPPSARSRMVPLQIPHDSSLNSTGRPTHSYTKGESAGFTPKPRKLRKTSAKSRKGSAESSKESKSASAEEISGDEKLSTPKQDKVKLVTPQIAAHTMPKNQSATSATSSGYAPQPVNKSRSAVNTSIIDRDAGITPISHSPAPRVETISSSSSGGVGSSYVDFTVPTDASKKF